MERLYTPMSRLAMVIKNAQSKNQLFAVSLEYKFFRATIANADIGSHSFEWSSANYINQICEQQLQDQGKIQSLRSRKSNFEYVYTRLVFSFDNTFWPTKALKIII